MTFPMAVPSVVGVCTCSAACGALAAKRMPPRPRSAPRTDFCRRLLRRTLKVCRWRCNPSCSFLPTGWRRSPAGTRARRGGQAAMLRECLASGSDTQKNSPYPAGAYRTGETRGTPSSSAVPMVMNRFGSRGPSARSPRALRLPPSHPRKAGQRLVQRADDERAIPHSRRHSFRRAASHVPDGEDVRSCRLQEQRLAAAAFSMLGEARVTPCVFAGDDESLLVEADQAGEVLGPRGGADHREHGRGGQPTLALIATDDRDGLELIAAVEGLDLAALPDLHVLGVLDAIDEIARHRRGQRASNHQVDAASVGGEVDHRLSGRVAAANDNHVLARGLERLEMSRRVVETQTLEALGSVGRQAAIVGTDGENDATGTHLLAVTEHQIPQPVHLR